MSVTATVAKKIDAVLFDLDGVIIDSNKAIISAWLTTAEEYGYSFTQAEVDRYIIGASHLFTLDNLFPDRSDSEKKVIHSKVDQREEEAIYRTIDGVEKFIYRLRNFDVKVGLVTSSWPEKIKNVMEQHNLNFDCIVCRNDVQRGKPDPQPYQLAMEKLAIAPENCLVFEDSDNGIYSAVAAGANCIAVKNDHFSHIPYIEDFNQLCIDDREFSYQLANANKGIAIRPL